MRIAAAGFEVINSRELARRWCVPESWIRDQVRHRAIGPIPHIKLGRYVRFEWGSLELNAWWAHHRVTGSKHGRNEDGHKGGVH
jgi:hypothetical protein